MSGPDAETAVRVAARAALDKNALDVAVLDLQGLSGIADYFLVCSARSTTQADTITDANKTTNTRRATFWPPSWAADAPCEAWSANQAAATIIQ